jgi:diaminohydroxyphosphoribosylaminopyrimidine deaminase / 5-amino-6-(5-phosphoribosylamino)uracil reductase
MSEALDLAKRGVGLTSPNPPVGAIVVSAEGNMIGSGYHRKAGAPHAEIVAIEDAMQLNSKLLRGSTIYVTLEPCSTHGRTPPCTERIKDAGIRRVVFGAADPNPKHTNQSYTILGASGIQVTGGVLEEECQNMIKPFAKWIMTGVPWVIAKVGQSLDGRITRPAGEPSWITSDSARSHGRRLRLRADAILIGAETLRTDNPHLTLRDADIGTGKEQPWRVVLTRSGRLPADAHLFTDEFKDRTIVLQNLSFPEVLRELGSRDIVTVLVEGGGNVMGQAFQSQEVDEVFWYIAPRICCSGRPSIVGLPLPYSIPLEHAKVLPIADNVCITGYPVWPDVGFEPAPAPQQTEAETAPLEQIPQPAASPFAVASPPAVETAPPIPAS